VSSSPHVGDVRHGADFKIEVWDGKRWRRAGELASDREEERPVARPAPLRHQRHHGRKRFFR